MSSKIVLQVKKDMRAVASKERALVSMRFFKTGKGQYGEGDVFLGLTVPDTRNLLKKYRDISHEDILQLLHSKIHEERMLALLILVDQFAKGDEKSRKKIFDLYLGNTKYINNWDLVDLTADRTIGAYLENRPKNILLKLAKSKSLWERRISILATFHFIKKGQSEWTLKIAEILLDDKEDLMHKAVGWMLREVGKRCSEEEECAFLDKHVRKMPRTMLRYAIERFSQEKKSHYMKIK